MESILFLVFLAAVMVVIYWAWRNDKTPIDKPTTGLLRMPQASDDGDPAPESETTGATQRGRPTGKPETR